MKPVTEPRKRARRPMQQAGLALLAMLLAGCANIGGGSGAASDEPFVFGRTVFLSAAKKVRDCKRETTCVVRVNVNPTPPGDGSNDCGITVDDFAVYSAKQNGVRALQWMLPEGTTAYQFRPTTPALNPPDQQPGIFVKDDDSSTPAFIGSRVGDLGYRLKIDPEKGSRGYVYGIYLNYRNSSTGPWFPCKALDPIIISLD